MIDAIREICGLAPLYFEVKSRSVGWTAWRNFVNTATREFKLDLDARDHARPRRANEDARDAYREF